MDEDRARYFDIEQMVNLSPKQKTFGITALKSNGNVITDGLSKAEILNSQFKSVLTSQSGSTFPQLPGTLNAPKLNH